MDGYGIEFEVMKIEQLSKEGEQRNALIWRLVIYKILGNEVKMKLERKRYDRFAEKERVIQLIYICLGKR